MKKTFQPLMGVALSLGTALLTACSSSGDDSPAVAEIPTPPNGGPYNFETVADNPGANFNFNIVFTDDSQIRDGNAGNFNFNKDQPAHRLQISGTGGNISGKDFSGHDLTIKGFNEVSLSSVGGDRADISGKNLVQVGVVYGNDGQYSTLGQDLGNSIDLANISGQGNTFSSPEILTADTGINNTFNGIPVVVNGQLQLGSLQADTIERGSIINNMGQVFTKAIECSAVINGASSQLILGSPETGTTPYEIVNPEGKSVGELSIGVPCYN